MAVGSKARAAGELVYTLFLIFWFLKKYACLLACWLAGLLAWWVLAWGPPDGALLEAARRRRLALSHMRVCVCVRKISIKTYNVAIFFASHIQKVRLND